MNPEKIYQWTKIICVICIAIFCAWLFDKNFVPRGKLVLDYNLGSEKTPYAKITGLSDPEKSSSDKRWYRRVVSAMPEFKLNLTRPYKKARITLEYNECPYRLLYFSAKQKTPTSQGEKITIIENKVLDETPWYRSEDAQKNLVLLQKGDNKCGEKQNNSDIKYEGCLYKYSEDKNPDDLLTLGNQTKKPWATYAYENFTDFESDFSKIVASGKKVATLDYDFLRLLKISGYQKSSKNFVFDKAFRGRHTIVTYIKNEPLDFKFNYQDINRQSGEDKFHVAIRQDTKILAQYSAKDDGITSANYKKTPGKELVVHRENLPEGFYEIELANNSDIVINKFETSQHLLAFQNRLSLFDAEQNLEFFTDATNLQISPLHKEALNQEIKSTPIAGAPNEKIQEDDTKISTIAEAQTIKIAKKQLHQMTLSGFNKISIPKNDLAVGFSGLAALNEETLKKFSFQNIKSLTDFNVRQNPDRVDYIVSPKFPAAKNISDNIKRQIVEYDLQELGAKGLKPKISFFLNVGAFDQNRGPLKLYRLKIELQKDPWTPKYLWNVTKSRFKK